MKVVHTFYAADRAAGLRFGEMLAPLGGIARASERTPSGEWGILWEHDVSDGEALFAATEQCEALATAEGVDYDGHEVQLG